jgi:gliding motility-associated-like protein
MRRITFLLFCIVSFYHGLSQQVGKVKHTVSNGLHIEGVDETNPVIYDNDMVLDTPEDEFLWLKAHNGKVKLVGNIITRDLIGCVFPAGQTCNVSLQEAIDGWSSTWTVAQAAGLKNVPKPVVGASEVMPRPASGRIEDTRFRLSAGSDLIINEAHKASAQKPLVVFVGGNVTTIANAYLKDPSIAPKVVVIQIHGYHNSPTKTVSYNTTDPWATYVVMKKFRYINWAGDSRSWYWTPVKNVNLTQSMINQLPNNPLANAVKTWYSRFFARESLADAPMVLYFFNHSLWRSVEKRLENGQITTSDTYDYLMVSGNDWTSYGPNLIAYMKDPNNYLSGASAPTPNIPPSIRLSSPLNNAQFTSGSTVSLIAAATDTDGTISKVEFYNGTTKLGEDTAAPYSFGWQNTVPGSFTITAKAIDNRGATSTSSPLSIIIQPLNTAPQVRITSPANNASVNYGAPIMINAEGSDTEGQIAKVEFFQGTTKLSEDISSPFSFSWTNVPAGKYSLSAKAFDDKGLSTTSSIVNIIVQAANTAPVVNIISPSNNSSVEYGSQISIAANASDASGTITKVEFYNGSNKLGEDSSSPFTFQWSNIAAGTYSLTAKAFDDKGLSTSSSIVNITVQAANTAPVVNITSPSNNSSVEYGSQISISANATDATGTITKVEFYNGSNKLGEDSSSPFTFQWSNVAAGTYSLTAKASDDKGLSTNSSIVNITVQAANTVPAVTITSPSHNTSVEYGTYISIAANATDATGTVTKVEFYSGNNKIGEDNTSPFAFLWTNAAAGTYSLTAKAFDDKGLTTTSSAVNITVQPVNTEPVVKITSPSHNTSLESGEQILIAANATDATGTVTKVEFYNGNNKLGEDTSSPFEFQWSNAAVGTHALTAKAIDYKGLTTISAVVSITIQPENVAPVVTLTAPAHNGSFTHGSPITITANASDNNGTVAKVEFYNGNTKLGEDTSSPYSFIWVAPGIGIHTLVAKAIDNQGVGKNSDMKQITVTAPPTVITAKITSPGNNTTFNHNTTVTIAAQASTTSGKIAKVEFYSGNVKLGEDLLSPYAYTWNGASTGSHTLTVKATTDKNESEISPTINIEIKSAPITDPSDIVSSINIVQPKTNTSFAIGSTVQIEVEAFHSAPISKIEFYSSDLKLGEATTKPYVFKTQLLSTGVHIIKAKGVSNGSIFATGEISIQILGHPTADAGENVTIALPENSITLKGSGKSADGTDLQHTWTLVEGPSGVHLNDASTHEHTIHGLAEGSYTFEYTVTDIRGLVAKDQVTVIVANATTALPEGSLPVIPRFFTPNDDGINDLWELPEHELLNNAVVMIFNSTGQKVYESPSTQYAWDGKLEGKPLQEDAYYYIIRVKDSNDIKGAVRIIR